MMGMKKVSLSLTDYEIAALHAWSAATGLTMAEILRRLIDQALKEYEADKRASERGQPSRE